MSFVAALATAIGEAATAGLVGMGVGAGTAATAGSIAGGIGAGALTGSALGAGSAALTGQDIGEGAGMGALTGAIGGGLTSGLGAMGSEAGTTLGTESLANQTSAAIPTAESMAPATNTATSVPTSQGIGALSANSGAGAITPTFDSAPAMNAPVYSGVGSAPIGGTQAVMNAVDTGGAAGSNIIGNTQPLSTSEKIGNWVNANKGLTAGGIGLLATPLVSGMVDASAPKAPGIKYPNIDPNKYRYSQPQWSVYQPTYMAAGGITDIDGYMSNAQNVPQDVKVPNPIDVANPTGYLGNSVQSYAIGGDIRNMADDLTKSSLPGMLFGWDSASDIPLIGGLFKKPEDIATLTPEEKQKLMAMAAQQGGQLQQPHQMAQGGIADLGSYRSGGSPNLLHDNGPSRKNDGISDGVSDDIEATIAGKQPARLASGEYVLSSRIVSELGNGSTDAGAKRLDQMVKRIQAGRHKTLKGKDYAKDTKAYKHLPV